MRHLLFIAFAVLFVIGVCSCTGYDNTADDIMFVRAETLEVDSIPAIQNRKGATNDSAYAGDEQEVPASYKRYGKMPEYNYRKLGVNNIGIVPPRLTTDTAFLPLPTSDRVRNDTIFWPEQLPTESVMDYVRKHRKFIDSLFFRNPNSRIPGEWHYEHGAVKDVALWEKYVHISSNQFFN